MTGRVWTKLTPEHFHRAAAAVAALPDSTLTRSFRLDTVEGLIAFVEEYAHDAAARRVKADDRRLAERRAATVLRGLEQNLENAISTIADLRAAADDEVDRSHDLEAFAKTLGGEPLQRCRLCGSVYGSEDPGPCPARMVKP